MKKNSALVALTASMLIFGTIGVFRRYIALNAAPLAMIRGAVGMLSLLVILLLRKQMPNLPAIRKNLVALIFSGAFLGINWILLFEAYNRTTIAVATLCYYMAPILVILVSPVLLKESLTPRKFLCVAIAIIGMVFVSGVLNTHVGGADLEGILYGLSAAVFYASVVLLNKKIHDISAYDKTIMQLGIAAVVLLPYVLLTEKGGFPEMSPFSVLMILIVGIVHTGIAYALYFGSVEHIPAQTAALFSYVDPITAILLSALLLSEPMGIPEIIGTVCIISAAVLSELPDRRK